MEKYYFTFGYCEEQPYCGGWIVVNADSRIEAIVYFNRKFGLSNAGCVKCADIYDERDFKQTIMYRDDQNGGASIHAEFSAAKMRSFGRRDCSRTVYENRDSYKDKVLIVQHDMLGENESAPKYQLFRVVDVFGFPLARESDAIHGYFVTDGAKDIIRLVQGDFIGEANDIVTRYAEDIEQRAAKGAAGEVSA